MENNIPRDKLWYDKVCPDWAPVGYTGPLPWIGKAKEVLGLGYVYNNGVKRFVGIFKHSVNGDIIKSATEEYATLEEAEAALQRVKAAKLRRDLERTQAAQLNARNRATAVDSEINTGGLSVLAAGATPPAPVSRMPLSGRQVQDTSKNANRHDRSRASIMSPGGHGPFNSWKHPGSLTSQGAAHAGTYNAAPGSYMTGIGVSPPCAPTSAHNSSARAYQAGLQASAQHWQPGQQENHPLVKQATRYPIQQQQARQGSPSMQRHYLQAGYGPWQLAQMVPVTSQHNFFTTSQNWGQHMQQDCIAQRYRQSLKVPGDVHDGLPSPAKDESQYAASPKAAPGSTPMSASAAASIKHASRKRRLSDEGHCQSSMYGAGISSKRQAVAAESGDVQALAQAQEVPAASPSKHAAESGELCSPAESGEVSAGSPGEVAADDGADSVRSRGIATSTASEVDINRWLLLDLLKVQ